MSAFVYKIINEKGEAEGVYSRSNHDVYEFSSAESARNSNCHDIYKNKAKYKIAKYKVTYELIDDDVDPATPEEAEDYKKEMDLDNKIDQEIKDKGITGYDCIAYRVNRIVMSKL